MLTHVTEQAAQPSARTAETGVERRPKTPNASVVIDQLVVDGLTSSGLPIDCERIARPLFGPLWRSDQRTFRLIDALFCDPRLLKVSEEGFVFRSEVAGPQREPSWQAIIAGTAPNVTPQQEMRVLQAIELYIQAVYDGYGDRVRKVHGIIAAREVQGMLHAKSRELARQGAAPTPSTQAAFYEFIKSSNNWLRILPDERVVLLGMRSDTSDVEPLQPVTDMLATVQAAVDLIGPRLYITPTLIWQVVEDRLGYFVTDQQRGKLVEVLNQISIVTVIHNTRFTTMSPAEYAEARERAKKDWRGRHSRSRVPVQAAPVD